MTLRLGLVLGLLLAAAIATWWLTATRGALAGAGDAASLATEALFLLSLARPMLAGVVALRAAALGGYGAGVSAALPVVSAAWPVVAIAWLASTDSLTRIFVTEAALVAFALFVPLAGHGLARVIDKRPLAATVATALGIALACGVWLLSDAWRPAAGA